MSIRRHRARYVKVNAAMSGQSNIERHPHVFLPRHIQELIGITDRQLRYWRNTGFFVPMKVREHLRYNFVDFCLLTCVMNMRGHGLSIQKMRKDQVPKLLARYEKTKEAGISVRDLSFAMSGRDPILFTGQVYMDNGNGVTQPVVFSQLWDAVREIRVHTRLDTLESVAI